MPRSIVSRLSQFNVNQQMRIGFGVVVVLLVVIALLSTLVLIRTKDTAREVLIQHQPTVLNAMQLPESLKDSMTNLGFYLLSPTQENKARYLQSVTKSEIIIRKLESRKAVSENPESLKAIATIKRYFAQLKELDPELFSITKSNLSNFPGMAYATSDLNPQYQELLGKLTILIQSEKDKTQLNKELIKKLYELRYTIARVMGGSRAFLGFRGKSSRKEMQNFLTRFDEILVDLEASHLNQLSFEQKNDIEQIKLVYKKFRESLNQMIHLHSGDKWRQDTYFVRSRIKPIVKKLNREIDNLVAIQLRDIHSANTSLMTHANTTTVMILIMLFVATISVIGLSFLLKRGIIKPMTETVNAGLNTFRKVMETVSDDSHEAGHTPDVSDDTVANVAMTFSLMAEALEEAIDRQKNASEKLNQQIDQILQVIESAAAGDLTSTLEFDGNETIDQLGNSIQLMLNHLNVLINQIKQSEHKVTSSVGSLTSVAKDHESSVSEQAASTQEVMATVTQISSTSRELADTMSEVSQVADETADSASLTQVALEKMETTMQQMNSATESIAAKLSILSEKAGNIGNVVTTINKVADQTNLLSLNAAIEAEKAGEYGRGFAVVATEIRRLADQTAIATWDIEQMVKEMQSAVSAGVMGMDKFSDEVLQGVSEVRYVSRDIAAIIDRVQALTPRFEAVNQGMRSQSKGASAIMDSMEQLNNVAHETADSLRTTNTNIDSLNEAASSLHNAVARFKVKS